MPVYLQQDHLPSISFSPLDFSEAEPWIPLFHPPPPPSPVILQSFEHIISHHIIIGIGLSGVERNHPIISSNALTTCADWPIVSISCEGLEAMHVSHDTLLHGQICTYHYYYYYYYYYYYHYHYHYHYHYYH